MTTAPQGTAARRASAPVAEREDKGNLYGILVIQLSMFFFVTNDMLAKLVTDSVPASQLIVVRCIFALAMLIAICIFTGEIKLFRQAFHKTVIWRALTESVAAIMFITALSKLPIGNITAILLTVPLATTAAAAIFLKEAVGIRRWVAVALGFVGVLAIVRPGLEGFNSFSLFALGAVVASAARDLITRQIPAGTSVWIVTLMTMIVSAIAGLFLSIGETWTVIEDSHYLFIAGSALFLTLGHFFIVIAMSHGEMSVVSSFRYISIIIALSYGYVLWGDVPDGLTWVGIALILGAGLYTIFRERKLMLRSKQATGEQETERASS